MQMSVAPSVPVCFFQSMEYQRLAAKDLVGWEDGVRRGLHAQCSRKGQLTNFKLALREVVTYMTVPSASFMTRPSGENGYCMLVEFLPWTV